MVLHEHLGHCGECHTACNLLGARHAARELAGNKNGPNGKKVANITPHPKDGLGGWRAGDITYYLKTGFLPDGDPDRQGHVRGHRGRHRSPQRRRSGGDRGLPVEPFADPATVTRSDPGPS